MALATVVCVNPACPESAFGPHPVVHRNCFIFISTGLVADTGFRNGLSWCTACRSNGRVVIRIRDDYRGDVVDNSTLDPFFYRDVEGVNRNNHLLPEPIPFPFEPATPPPPFVPIDGPARRPVLAPVLRAAVPIPPPRPISPPPVTHANAPAAVVPRSPVVPLAPPPVAAIPHAREAMETRDFLAQARDHDAALARLGLHRRDSSPAAVVPRSPVVPLEPPVAPTNLAQPAADSLLAGQLLPTIIREDMRFVNREAIRGLLREDSRRRLVLRANISSEYYVPNIEDLCLLEQMLFFTESDPVLIRNEQYGRPLRATIRAKIAEILPPQLLALLTTATGSTSGDDFLSDTMVFLSADNNTCIAVSYDYFAKFIARDPSPRLAEIEWSQIYFLRRPAPNADYAVLPVRDLSELFALFPLFRDAYLASRLPPLTNLINTIFGRDANILRIITTAVNSPSSHIKLTEIALQQQLIVWLRDFFQAGTVNFDNPSASNNAALTADTLANIFRIFEYTEQPQAQKNFLLLGLALFFVRLSSSQVCGTEYDSPIAIRLFSVALLNHIQRDAPFFDAIQGWKNRVLGREGAFTCTDLVAGTLHATLRAARADILDLVYPRAWR